LLLKAVAKIVNKISNLQIFFQLFFDDDLLYPASSLMLHSFNHQKPSVESGCKYTATYTVFPNKNVKKIKENNNRIHNPQSYCYLSANESLQDS